MQNSKNKPFIAKIAERESNYAILGTNESISNPFIFRAGERYKALNINNKNTLEFRIFATPMNFKTFCKNIEFCDALTSFCSSGNSGIKEMNVEHFVNFINKTKSEYPNLIKFLDTV